MTIIKNDEGEYLDNVAEAERVTVVGPGGAPVFPLPVSRVTSITRVATAMSTPITAGKQSYTVTVVSAASAASPTLDGVALPAGYTATFSISNPGDTLEAATLVTVSGDDVIILAVT